MTTLLPLSQFCGPRLETSVDVHRSLATLGAFQNVPEVAPALDAISGAVRSRLNDARTIVGRDGTTRTKDLRFFSGLNSDDETRIRLALSELASRPAVLSLLRDDHRAAAALLDSASRIRIDTSDVQRRFRQWSGPAGVRSPELGICGGINYWLSSLAAPKNWGLWTTAASLAVEGGLWAGTGHSPATAIATSAALLGGAVYGYAHREAAQTRLLNTARRQRMNFEAVSEYFRSFDRALPTASPFRLAPGSTDVLEAIRQSSAGSGTAHTNRLITLQVIADFLNLGSAAVKSLEEDPTGKLYDQLAQAIGLGVLSRLGWHPIILNTHVLDQIAELKRQGKNIIFVSNHRSHLDILLAVALLRDFGIRFAAKKELKDIPILGQLLHGADHFLVDDNDPNGLESMVAWGIRMFGRGCSPFFFLEGTRSETPVRLEEVGMGPPKIGAAHLAARRPRDTYIVKILNYGFGRMLSKSKVIRQGTMVHQPTVTYLMEPTSVSDFLDDHPNLSMEEEARFNSIIWGDMSEILSAIQAYMNYLAVQAA